MGDAAAGDEQSERGSGRPEPDRRRLIDLIRAERGEPERRKLLGNGKPGTPGDAAPSGEAE